MKELEFELQQLLKVLEDNLQSHNKNLWLVCFHWWRYYRHFNQHIDNCATLEEKVTLINTFFEWNKEINKIHAEVIQQAYVHVKAAELDELNIDDPRIPPYAKDMIRTMRQERQEFGKRLRATKREKDKLIKNPSKQKKGPPKSRLRRSKLEKSLKAKE